MNAGVIGSIGIFFLRVMIALAALTFAASDMAFAQDDELKIDYFAKYTSLSEKDLRDFLSQERCYTDENSFLGCMEAISTIYTKGDTPLVLVNQRTRSLPWLKEVAREVEGVQLSKVSQRKQSGENIDFKLITIESNLAWKKLFAKTKKNPISIERLLNDALSQKISKFRTATLARAINTYLINAVDAHAAIGSTEADKRERNKKEDNYFGIGALVNVDKNLQVILNPMAGSPALASGLRRKDILTGINRTEVKLTKIGDLNDYIKLLRGPENTVVQVTVLREGQSVNLNITLGRIVSKILEGKIVTNPKTNQKIGYIKLTSFMRKGLCKDFVVLAKSLYSQGAESLILDVRNNGGGDLHEVLCMAGSYIDNKQAILSYQNPTTNQVFDAVFNQDNLLNRGIQSAELYNLFGKNPLVMLLNSLSASASELLPGALKPHGRVVIVGERSFGKGTVQQYTQPEAVGLNNIEGVFLKRTVARFHFADTSTNQLTGIQPDFEIYPSPTPTGEDKKARREVDLYPNAIHAGLKSPGIIPEKTRIRISKCVASNSNIEAEYEQDEKSALGADYQLIYAKAVASCL